VAQVPAFAEGGPDLPTGALAAITQALEQGRDELVLPATTPSPDGDGIMFEDGAHDWMTRVSAERAPTWRNEVRVSALLEPFRPIDHLANAKVPLLLLVAPADALTPPGPAMALAASAALVEVMDIPGGHFAAYESAFTASIEPTIAFLHRHLDGH
jgi:pimeloyl-ACP methyl ester carboxylesterase